jgi:hypothetical protein
MRTTINTADLVDIRDVQVDANLSRKERVSEYNRQIKDPNHYKCRGLTVTAKYPKNGATFEECLRSMVL